jgi:hypothetical protein
VQGQVEVEIETVGEARSQWRVKETEYSKYALSVYNGRRALRFEDGCETRQRWEWRVFEISTPWRSERLAEISSL